jgi:hypothetical protein
MPKKSQINEYSDTPIPVLKPRMVEDVHSRPFYTGAFTLRAVNFYQAYTAYVAPWWIVCEHNVFNKLSFKMINHLTKFA